MTVSGGPPFIRRGAGWRAYRQQRRPAAALPVPIPATFTQAAHRDPLTGRWAKLLPLHPQPAKLGALGARGEGLRVVRYVTEYSDGSREVARVQVRHMGARAARRRGVMSAAELREFERGLADDMLNELNPRLREAWELGEMHAAHASDKATRGARSKVRNQAARDAERPPAPVVQVSAAVSVNRADLLAMLAQLPDTADTVLLRVRKVEGKVAELQATTGALHILSIQEC